VKEARAHGPVEIWTYFFLSNPFVISKATLLSYEHQDIFGVCVIDKQGNGTGIFEMPLSSVRKAVQWGAGAQKATGMCMTSEKKEFLPVIVREERGNVFFTIDKWGPVWITLEDIKPIL